MCARLLSARRYQSVGVVQEGIRILMQRYGLGVATLDDVFVALLDGAKATISQGECSAQDRLRPTVPLPLPRLLSCNGLKLKGSLSYPRLVLGQT